MLGRSGNRDVESAALTNLGFCYLSLGDYRQAIDLHTQVLTIDRDTGNRDYEGAALSGLGICYYSLGDYRQAIDLHTQALVIARDTGNRDYEGLALSHLGLCYYRLGDYRQAIELYTQALTIARDTGNRNYESHVLCDLGNYYYSLGDYQQAIDLHTQALTIARDIDSGYREATALVYLGRAWLASGDAAKAVTLLEEAVSVADTTGDIEPAAEARSGLTLAHLHLADPAAALATATAARGVPYRRGTKAAAAARSGPWPAPTGRGGRAGLQRCPHQRRDAAGTSGAEYCCSPSPCTRPKRAGRSNRRSDAGHSSGPGLHPTATSHKGGGRGRGQRLAPRRDHFRFDPAGVLAEVISTARDL